MAAAETPSLVWFGNDGSATLWQMQGPVWAGGGATVLQIPSPWRLATAGDLNGDGHPDLVWEATSDGLRAVTFMNGGAYAASYAMMFVIPPEWKIIASMDFDGDNKPDLVLSNTTTGDNGVLYLNGTTWTGVFAPLPNFGSTSKLVAVGDMNGDLKPDLVTQNTATGQPSIYFLDGTTVSSSASVANVPGADWVIGAAADFDLDGKTDLVLQNTTSGLRSIWLMNGVTRSSEVVFTSVPTSSTIVAATLFHWSTVPVASVSVTLAETSVKAGEVTQGAAQIKDGSGNLMEGRSVKWASDNAGVASVSSTGVITAVSAGIASIRAMSEGQSGSATLTVTAVATDVTRPEVVSLSFSPATLDITGGAVTTIATMRITDSGSGVNVNGYYNWVALQSPVGTGVGCGNFVLATGTINDGTFTCALTIPAGAATGNWTVSSLNVADIVGNGGGGNGSALSSGVVVTSR